MGLFDSLPPPSKEKKEGTAAKRAPADPPPPAQDNGNKKQRLGDGGPPPLARPAAQCGGSTSIVTPPGHAAAPRPQPFIPIAAAYSEDKGSRLTMEDIAVIHHSAWSGSSAAAAEGGAGSSAGADSAEAPASAAAASGPPAGGGRVRVSFLAIFDGHGGANVARYAADRLHPAVMKAGLAAEAERLAAAAAAGSKQHLLQANLKHCKAAVTEGFRELDREVLEQCAAVGWADGCTAVAVWVLCDTVLVANVGDARCVLARRPAEAAVCSSGSGVQQHQQQGSVQQQQRRQSAADAEPPRPECQAGGQQDVQQQHQRGQQQGGQQGQQQGGQQGQQQGGQQQQQQQQGEPEPLKAITLTREHKAIFPQERQRIEKAGSFVSNDGRLAGRIEVSRAFGDRQFKKSGMSAVPDIQAFHISRRDAFLLLACDGFWGVFSPQDAVDFAQRELGERGSSVKLATQRLIHNAIRERRCKDNCTVMLVQLQHPPAAAE